jgi:hypothetical protein
MMARKANHPASRGDQCASTAIKLLGEKEKEFIDRLGLAAYPVVSTPQIQRLAYV